MHGSEPLDSLDFDDHSTFDHKVKAIPAVELDILVHHREWLLLLNFEAAVSEFEDETRLVGRLQQPGPIIRCTSMAAPMTCSEIPLSASFSSINSP